MGLVGGFYFLISMENFNQSKTRLQTELIVEKAANLLLLFFLLKKTLSDHKSQIKAVFNISMAACKKVSTLKFFTGQIFFGQVGMRI